MVGLIVFDGLILVKLKTNVLTGTVNEIVSHLLSIISMQWF